MRTILTFNSVYDTDLELTGSLAQDVARASRLVKVTPPSFIITTSVLNKILDDGLRVAIKKVMSDPSHGLDVKRVFSAYKIDPVLLEELKEAYESLYVGGKDLLESKDPVVNLYLSLDYFEERDYHDLSLLNIQGFDMFVNACKSLWLKLFDDVSVEYRKKNGIDFFSAAIIVQKAAEYEATVEVFNDGKMAYLDAYRGLFDMTRKVTKDKIEVSLSDIENFKLKVQSQEYRISSSERKGHLVKIYLKDKSSLQKVDNLVIGEVIRLVKKVKLGFGSGLKAVFGVKKGQVSLLLAQSIPSLEVEEVEMIKAPEVTKALPFDNGAAEDVAIELGLDEDLVDEQDVQHDFSSNLGEDLVDESSLETKSVDDSLPVKELEDEVSGVEESVGSDSLEDLDEETVEDYIPTKVDLNEDYKTKYADDELEVPGFDEDSNGSLDSDDAVDDLKEKEDGFDADYDLSDDSDLKSESDDFVDLSVKKEEGSYFDDQNDSLDVDLDEASSSSSDFIGDLPEIKEDEEVHLEDEDDFLLGSTSSEESGVEVEKEVEFSEVYKKFLGVVFELYTSSFGMSPSGVGVALKELDSKYGLKNVDELVDFVELMNRRLQGAEVSDDMLMEVLASVELFIKENA